MRPEELNVGDTFVENDITYVITAKHYDGGGNVVGVSFSPAEE